MRSILLVSIVCSAIAFTGSAAAAQAVGVLQDPNDATPHWYEVVAAPAGITWAQAQAAAQAAGGYLASITTAVENDYVASLVLQSPGAWYYHTPSARYIGPWIGGMQPPGSPEPAGNWRWTSIESPTFAAWGPGLPDNAGGAEDRIHYSAQDYREIGRWDDAPASSTRVRGFVIEYSGPTVPTTTGLFLRDPRLSEGYTLFGPIRTRNTTLVDSWGRSVKFWTSQYNGLSLYLLADGSLIRNGVAPNPMFPDGHRVGGTGVIERFDWNGQLVWQYVYSDNNVYHHHDFEVMPNGNILLVAWEHRTVAQAVAAGRDPTLLPEGALWPLKIAEIQPVGATGGRVVWEWSAWDHLIQDFDRTKANYGVVGAHPELIDLNYDTSFGIADWMHTNSIDYNASLDQILVSVRAFDEIWVIDHSTTTAEAATHSGGRSGKGGDLLYRWGNPQAYRAGDEVDRQLFKQHDAQWIPASYPGGGNILVFNNGQGRPGTIEYSSVEEITPPLVNGAYVRNRRAFGPTRPTWSYRAKNPGTFYSSFISGCERLPNGNTLICEGATARFFEVDPQGNVRWEYVSPSAGGKRLQQGEVFAPDGVFRCHRYAPNDPAFSGKTVTPGEPIEIYREALLANGTRRPGYASIGTNVDLTLVSVGDVGRPYQLVSSLTAGAVGIDFRRFGVGFDDVAVASLLGAAPAIFRNYRGSIGAMGRAKAELRIPTETQLIGRTVRTAFVTLDATVRSGVRTISNTCDVYVLP